MTTVRREIDDNAIRAELGRILASPEFDATERNRRFLRYVVEETLGGRASRIKAYSIATSVFGRGPDFDAQLDSIVRIEAGRLRRALDRYYLTAGRADQVRISIPRGAYLPVFLNASDAAAAEAVAPSLPAGRNQPARRGCAILVVPFEMEGDPSAYRNLDHGLTRQVIIGLTRFADLFVYGAETALASRANLAEPTMPVAPDLLLSGGMTVSADRFTLEVLLSDARSGRFIWGETFDRPLDPASITHVRNEVADGVVRSIAQPYGVIFSQQAREIEGKPPESLSSYESVLLFQEYWRTYDRTLFWKVRERLEEAIRHDPDYAEAFACLSLVCSNWRRFDHAWPPGSPDPQERALALARRAIELAPHSSRSHHALALACWFSGDAAAGIAALERGLALNPNDTELMSDLGLRHAVMMRWDRAVPLLEDSYARNPEQPANHRIGLALWHYMAGRYEEALVEMRRANPQHVVQGFLLVAAAAAQLGRKAEAEAAVRSVLGIAPDYGDRVVADLEARNLHPSMIAAVVDGLRKAGLPCRDAMDELGVRDAAAGD
ncbi:tetratricopeptide repeat protein [Roseomonas rosulenta]|uniref:tetratricopeptide repeat protein n=1 Tax=Roseomonas rosulenta TaxID=2748667 RepID=UPI0018DF63D1|nr:hypothetical protein [Roseomonas rosulenta]